MINPMIIYVISILDKLNTVSILFMIFAITSMIISVLTLLLNDYFDLNSDEDDLTKAKIVLKVFKISLVIAIISMIFSIVLPREETATKMLITSKITTENIEKVESTIKSSVDYIIDKMKEN